MIITGYFSPHPTTTKLLWVGNTKKLHSYCVLCLPGYLSQLYFVVVANCLLPAAAVIYSWSPLMVSAPVSAPVSAALLPACTEEKRTDDFIFLFSHLCCSIVGFMILNGYSCSEWMLSGDQGSSRAGRSGSNIKEELLLCCAAAFTTSQ